MKCYNLFLDDERIPKGVFLYKPEPVYTEQPWTIVRSYDSFVNKVTQKYTEGYFPCVVSFDHDLAREHYLHGALSRYEKFDETAVNVPTGWHCLKWLLKFCETQDFVLPKILFHSMNKGGTVNMTALIDEYKAKRNRDV